MMTQSRRIGVAWWQLRTNNMAELMPYRQIATALLSAVALALTITSGEAKEERERPFMCCDPFEPIEIALCSDAMLERLYLDVDRQFGSRLEALAGKRGEDQLYSSQLGWESGLAKACLSGGDGEIVQGGATRACLHEQLEERLAFLTGDIPAVWMVPSSGADYGVPNDDSAIGRNYGRNPPEPEFSEEKPTRVTNCQEYFEALEAGWSPGSTRAVVAAGWFKRDCMSKRILDAAVEARVSWIDEPRVGVSTLHLLSPTMLPLGMGTPEMLEDGEKRLQGFADAGQSYESLAKAGTIAIKHQTPTELQIWYEDKTWKYLKEMGRADLNGDGVQDILVFGGSGSVGGSFQTYGLYGLTRKGPQEMLEKVTYNEAGG